MYIADLLDGCNKVGISYFHLSCFFSSHKNSSQEEVCKDIVHMIVWMLDKPGMMLLLL